MVNVSGAGGCTCDPAPLSSSWVVSWGLSAASCGPLACLLGLPGGLLGPPGVFYLPCFWRLFRFGGTPASFLGRSPPALVLPLSPPRPPSASAAVRRRGPREGGWTARAPPQHPCSRKGAQGRVVVVSSFSSLPSCHCSRPPTTRGPNGYLAAFTGEPDPGS